MQKLADGQDTDVGSSPPWLRSRCVAAPQAGAAPDRGVAGWPPVGERAPGSGGADDDPLHPVAAPISKMATQANARPGRLIRLVPTVRPYGFRRNNDTHPVATIAPSFDSSQGHQPLSLNEYHLLASSSTRNL